MSPKKNSLTQTQTSYKKTIGMSKFSNTANNVQDNHGQSEHTFGNIQKPSTNSPFEQVREYFIFGPLGSGSYCTVKKAIHKDNSAKTYAMKIVDIAEIRLKLIQKNMITDGVDQKVDCLTKNEVRIFEKIESFKKENPEDESSKYIIGLKEIFEEREKIYIILELAEKGYFLSNEFWKHIFKRRAKNLKKDNTFSP